MWIGGLPANLGSSGFASAQGLSYQGGTGRRKSKKIPANLRGYVRPTGFYGRYRAGAGDQERKFHDLDVDDAVVATGGTVTHLNVIAQGVTEATRVGRKCTITHIGWRYTVRLPETVQQASPTAGDTVRLMLILDKQANGAIPSVTDVLESAEYQSFNNLANKGRFRVLMDRTIDINYLVMASDAASKYDQGQVEQSDSFYKKCNITIEYDSTTGAITEVRSNNLLLLAISSQGTASFVSKLRLRFTDS